MNSLIAFYNRITSSFADLSLLLVRLTLAYGFYEPALKKLAHFDNIVIWFDQGLHLPFPYLNAVMATGAEALGVISLVLGLKTRIFSLPLMVTMLVAIFMVHFDNGFAAKANGFEIPFYYFIMLSVLLTHGAGKFSLDGRD
ncbi:MAG: DoxX family protein [Cyanobacteria bacterium]|nr:DoxX family protein [Cyanobacteriota bacterium]MDA1020238.1 DoxX family protein [Cyanobacteriota bacterium]